MPESVSTAVGATVLNEIMASGDFLKSDYEPGDVITYQNGRAISVRRGSSSSGNGGGTWNGFKEQEPGLTCIIAYTNSGFGDVAQRVCY